jgi:hypothetical protein
MSLTGTFTPIATVSIGKTAPAKPKVSRPAPFSLRLSDEERARLTAEANGSPLGTFIKAKLVGAPMPVRTRRTGLAVEDRQALAQALALLGRSRLASNLNQLAHLANVGALPVDQQTEAELAEAVCAIRDIRNLLLFALGLKPEDRP